MPPRSGRRWPATSAAAPATPRSLKPSCWQPRAVADLKVVGQPLPKADAAAKVIGAAVYADDIVLPRMLHSKLLRSPHPHARILSVDASAARRIHASRSLPANLHRLQSYEFGDLAAGWARAAHVREDLFFFQGNTHLPMEQHSAVGQWVDGRLTVWSSTQVVHYVHRALSKVLELPMTRIRVIGAVHGGGFGG